MKVCFQLSQKHIFEFECEENEQKQIIIIQHQFAKIISYIV